jgi:hypothetical protein
MDDADWLHQEFAKDIAQARAEERERCARIAESFSNTGKWAEYGNPQAMAEDIAAAIRNLK